MDITTMMMSSTSQPSPVSAGAGGMGQAAQAGVFPGNGQGFHSVLATSLQTQQSVPASSMVVAKEPPVMDLAAVMALLTDATERGSAIVGQDASGKPGMDKAKALSVMQLLQNLKASLEEFSSRTGGDKLRETQAGNGDLQAVDIRSLLDNHEQLLSELGVTLRGRLNPAVVDKESQLEAYYNEAVGQTPDAQGAGEQLAQLLNAINTLLPQIAGRNLDKNVEEGNVSSAMPMTVPVTAPLQQNAAQADIPDPLRMMKTIPAEGVAVIRPEESSANTASAEVSDSAARTSESTVADAAQRDPLPPMSAQNKGVKIQPVAVQLPELHGQEAEQAQESSEVDSIEILVREEEPVPGQSQPAARQQEPAPSDKRDMPRTDAVLAFSAEAKQLQPLSDRPVAEEPATITREQIVSQVREKIAEHRITQDNGQITIRLNPAELGELKISVRMDDQRLRVEIVAENRMVKDALMENLGSLKEALARQNVEMKQFDVSTGSRQFFNQGFREGRQQDFNQVASRPAGWLTGRMEDPDQSVSASWQSRENALLDMMM